MLLLVLLAPQLHCVFICTYTHWYTRIHVLVYIPLSQFVSQGLISIMLNKRKVIKPNWKVINIYVCIYFATAPLKQSNIIPKGFTVFRTPEHSTNIFAQPTLTPTHQFTLACRAVARWRTNAVETSEWTYWWNASLNAYTLQWRK